MKTGSLKRALGLVLIYIGVFVLIVALQFSRSPGFSQRIGRLAVSASYPQNGGAKPAPSSVRIDFGGMAFILSKDQPAQVKAVDGSLSPVLPLSVEKLPDGARIVLEGGTELVARADQAGSSFSLSARRSDEVAAALILPCSLPPRALVAGQDGSSLLKSAGSSFALAFSSAEFAAGNGKLSLSFADGASPRLSLSHIAEAKPAPVVAAKSPPPAAKPGKLLPPAALDAASYKAGLDAYSAKVWSGLSSDRWSADAGGWKDGAGSISFSEKASVAYLAEASQRGGYADAIARVRQLAAKNRSALTWLSVPYLGNTVERMTGLETADQSEAARLASLVQNKDASLLDKEGLVPFILDRSPRVLASEAFGMIGGMDATKLGTKAAAAYFCRAMEARALLSDSESPFKAVDSVAVLLQSRLAKSPEGYFIQTEEDGSVDLRLSLAIGQAFVAYAGQAGKEGFLGLGQSLVLGVLGLADGSGFLPARLVLRGDQTAEKSGSIAPEACYALAVANPYYPHELSFYKELGAGAWAWTSSPSVSVSSGSAQAVFSVSYPEGRAHYMAVYGTKSFSTIKLYGIDYSPDSAFESYDVSGYLYRKASNGLYLKMKHKQPTEKIELYY
jgi:hypothetical protein